MVVSIVRNSPVLYKSEGGNPEWAVAMGGYDSAISIWKESDKKPLVIKDLFEAAVADISWSSNGEFLMACSSDGSVATIMLSDTLGEVVYPELPPTAKI